MTAAKRPASRGGIGRGKGGDSSSTRGRSAAAPTEKPSGSQTEAKRREAEEEKACKAKREAKEKRRREKEEARAAAAAAAEAAEEGAEVEDEGDVADPVIDPDIGKTVKKPLEKQKAEKDLPLASELPWHNFSLVAEQASFRQAVEPVQVGKVLIARLYDAVEQFEAEAAFLIREVNDHKTGPLLGVDFVGASKPANQIRIEVGDGEGESMMIHLCQSHPECGRRRDAKNTLHLSEWKLVDARHLDMKWVTASMRQACQKLKKRFSRSSLTDPPWPPSEKAPLADFADLPPGDRSDSELPAGPPKDKKGKKDKEAETTLPSSGNNAGPTSKPRPERRQGRDR